jgi:hypothetical protein
LELPAEKRPDFLHRTCKGDRGLRTEIESLLEAHASAGSFIDDRSNFHEEFDEGDATLPLTIGPYRIVRE